MLTQTLIPTEAYIPKFAIGSRVQVAYLDPKDTNNHSRRMTSLLGKVGYITRCSSGIYTICIEGSDGEVFYPLFWEHEIELEIEMQCLMLC